MTRGERIIGSFNPSQNDYVSAVKAKFSELIDFIDSETKVFEDEDEGYSKETLRDVDMLKSLAFTKLEEAALFAAKVKEYFK